MREAKEKEENKTVETSFAQSIITIRDKANTPVMAKRLKTKIKEMEPYAPKLREQRQEKSLEEYERFKKQWEQFSNQANRIIQIKAERSTGRKIVQS